MVCLKWARVTKVIQFPMSIWTSPSIWKLTGRKAPRTLLHGIWETSGGWEVYIVLAHYDGAWATIKDIHTSRNIQSPPSSLNMSPRCPFSLSFDWVGCSAWWHKHTDATAPLTTPPNVAQHLFCYLLFLENWIFSPSTFWRPLADQKIHFSLIFCGATPAIIKNV